MNRIWMFFVLAGFGFSLFAQENIPAEDTTKKKVVKIRTIENEGDTLIMRVGKKEVVLSGNGEDATVIPGEEEKTDTTKGEKTIYQNVDNGNKTRVMIGNKPLMEIIENDDTVVIRMGKKGIKIIETPDGSTIKVVKEETNKSQEKKKKRKFKGSWKGISFGMNNYLTPDFQYTNNFLNVYDGKSWNINFNIMQYSASFSHSGNVGLVTGLGVRLNDYKFSGNNNITKDSSGYIVGLPYPQNLKVSKLNVGYITVPLLFEIQTGHYHNGFRMAFGVVGSLKVRSYTRIKWYENGKKAKNKIRGDYNISPLDYALTARFGVSNLDIYANYSMVPLFKKDQGPEVYPFAIGLGWRF